jgi:hypothetical protein
MEKEKGSILVLTAISTLILSIIMTGLLTIGTTELHTTQNYQLTKIAHYSALEGVEVVRNLIAEAESTEDIDTITKTVDDTGGREIFSGGSGTIGSGVHRSYITGSLLDFQEETPQPVGLFKGFKAPPLLGASQNLNLTPIIWKVYITSQALMGNKAGFSEIVSGIYYTVSSYD